MCGIIGIFGKNDPKGRSHKSLEKITHRGSNIFELEHFDNGSLGANRLPIVDRNNGRQPKSNEDGTKFVAQNGEIFNHRELREELSGKGHKFKTDSDTEVLVHLYEEYGPEMVNKLDSEMFAFVIYDKANGDIFAARDPLGVKPLYYAYDTSGQVYFASELKQLSFFDDIEEIFNFPPGCYFLNGKFKEYFALKETNELKDERKALSLLEKQVIDAVKKRVDTDLPIGVFLSGGVDSSLIMEIATRFHPDVTAIILGYPGASDYEYALRLCQDRKYKYQVVHPDVDYEKELDNLIYHLETYEPLIIRQSFSLDICAKEAQRLGLSVVLVGEGSDELFGGYNEFSNLPANIVNKGCVLLTESLSSGHLLRVDRMSMKHTVEVRCPFFDKEVMKTALRISGDLKIKRENHQIITKYILRKLAANFLPDYIAWRYKVPFSNGAGMNVGNNFKSQDGDVAKVTLEKPEVNLPTAMLKKYAVSTKEGKYYLNKFGEFNFTKLVGSENRIVVKDTLNDLAKSKKTRFLVGEFDRLAIYFPAYFASEKNIFNLHNLDVDFIATGGDDKTYASLVNNSAHIGLSDPMFAMFENKEGVKGEIIGELVKSTPNLAIAINPNIKISSIEDFSKYKVGTFQEYSTTYNITKYLLPEETVIIPLDYKEVINKLVDRSIDVAIILPEQAFDFEALGGTIVFDFRDMLPNFLFAGFTIANILEPKYRKGLKSFVVSVRESIRYIRKNEKEAYEVFIKLFPDLKQPQKVFNEYLKIWSTTVKVDQSDYKNAYKAWNENYPELLKKYLPYVRKNSVADPVIEKINSSEYRRDYPFLEDVLEKRILESLEKREPLRFVGFWGVGEKSFLDEDSKKTIDRFKEYVASIGKVLGGDVEVTWMLADAHAENNGYQKKIYSNYLMEVEGYLKKSGFKPVYLSKLWRKWGIDKKLIAKTIENQKKGWWNDISIATQLEDQSGKRFKGRDDALRGAQKYYTMRKIEKGFLEKEFKNSIFIHFADGRMQSIFPTLPSVYLYTTEKGTSDVPWFTKNI